MSWWNNLAGYVQAAGRDWGRPEKAGLQELDNGDVLWRRPRLVVRCRGIVKRIFLRERELYNWLHIASTVVSLLCVTARNNRNTSKYTPRSEADTVKWHCRLIFYGVDVQLVAFLLYPSHRYTHSGTGDREMPILLSTLNKTQTQCTMIHKCNCRRIVANENEGGAIKVTEN